MNKNFTVRNKIRITQNEDNSEQSSTAQSQLSNENLEPQNWEQKNF